MLRRKPYAFRIQQNSHRRHHIFEIQQRLALPHQHHIRSRRQSGRLLLVAAAFQGGRFFSRCDLRHCLPLSHLLQRQQHLRHHFSRRQIPDQSQLRRQAKLAVHSAACLRRNANRLPSLARHEHRFHCRRLLQQFFFLRRQSKQIPHRSIRRHIPLPHRRQSDRCLSLQLLPQRRRQIAPPLGRELPLRVQPVIKLVRTISRFPQPGEIRLQFFPVFPQQFQALLPRRLHSLTRTRFSAISCS